MKKIPSLFERDYKGDRLVYPKIVSGSEWVLLGEGLATEKYDGTSCMVKDGVLYKRYDRKLQKSGYRKHIPSGWIPCNPLPVATEAHWFGWCFTSDEDKWHEEALSGYQGTIQSGTYELVGPKVQSNPYGLGRHELWKHGDRKILVAHYTDPIEMFEETKKFLVDVPIEGIVWHHKNDDRMVKIKRRDFFLEWPIKEVCDAVRSEDVVRGDDPGAV